MTSGVVRGVKGRLGVDQMNMGLRDWAVTGVMVVPSTSHSHLIQEISH